MRNKEDTFSDAGPFFWQHAVNLNIYRRMCVFVDGTNPRGMWGVTSTWSDH